MSTEDRVVRCMATGESGFLSTLQVVFLIAVGGWIFVGIKVLPLFIQYYELKTALYSLKQEAGLANWEPRTVLNALQKRLEIDSIYDIKDENVQISRDRRALRVRMVYYAERSLIGTLTVGLTFDDMIEVGLGGP